MARRLTGPTRHPSRLFDVRVREGSEPDLVARRGRMTVDGVDVTSPFSLTGLLALVTGASSGLGARFARVLHAAGAEVVVTARRGELLEMLAAELGERVRVVPCDISDARAREQLMTRVERESGPLRVLVNNAGIALPGRAEDETVDQIRRVMEVNTVAPFHLAQLAARQMFAHGGGSIINIASVLGLVAAAPIQQASYCASKGALVNLTRELAGQWARRGVRVNAIAPGWFPSGMTDDLWSDASSAAYIERNTPLGRHGYPNELDAVLLLLAGPGSSFITGQVLAVDGGWTAR
jgi:NAD(P)-dependent dehydrogenase (short-subunit alcohol dehydrogenase family)